MKIQNIAETITANAEKFEAILIGPSLNVITFHS